MTRLKEKPTLELDHAAIDDAVLGLLWLGLHEHQRVWKSFDWSAMERLHSQGFITDPFGKAKSVMLTEDGMKQAKTLFRERFTRREER